MIRERIEPIWRDMAAIVAATGPSLTKDVAGRCQRAHEAGTHAVIAVNDAWRLMPFAQLLYASDAAWWRVHDGCPGFAGEKWSSHHAPGNDKLAAAERHGLNLVRGRAGKGFSFDPERIHYGSNSTFQAVNLAILMGVKRIVLVGVNMQALDGRSHFFGDHPPGLRSCSSYRNFIGAFEAAAAILPDDIEILNATPASALRCFPGIDLDRALQ